MIKRQLHESDSLLAIQKMDFQSKVQELILKHKLAATNNSSLIVSASQLSTFQFQLKDYHVPIVSVNSKLDLFDLSLIIGQKNKIHKSPKNSLNSEIFSSFDVN
mgnify:CR=1 FL=1